MKHFIQSLLLAMILWPAGAYAAPCVNPPGDEGDQVYNITYHIMQYCNGSHWVAMGSVMGQGDNLGDHAAGQTLDMSDFRIENLAPPTADNHAVTRGYVTSAIAAIPTPDTPNLSAVLAQGNAAGNTVISGLANPSANNEAATKEYVDTIVASASGGGGSGIMWGDTTDSHLLGLPIACFNTNNILYKAEEAARWRKVNLKWELYYSSSWVPCDNVVAIMPVQSASLTACPWNPTEPHVGACISDNPAHFTAHKENALSNICLDKAGNTASQIMTAASAVNQGTFRASSYSGTNNYILANGTWNLAWAVMTYGWDSGTSSSSYGCWSNQTYSCGEVYCKRSYKKVPYQAE